MRAPDSTERRPLALVGIGSNLGDSRQLIAQAVQRLRTLSDRPLRVSSFWRTDPVDCPPGSPTFLNAAVALEPRAFETPESLLTKLQAIETDLGRRRTGTPNEPRTLDLDLLAFGALTRSTPELTLPHPRAHLRAFVLAPLNEIFPRCILPGQTQSVSELLAELTGAPVVRIGPVE